MRDLLELAVMLRQLSGRTAEAMTCAERLGAHGQPALAELGIRGDAALALAAKARHARVIRADGSGDRVRAAELVVLLDVLDAAPPTPAARAADRELVFTVPRSVGHLVAPRQRLDLLVNDVIARAEHTLHIGGPFWNADGWQMLKPVVLPALNIRGVHVTFYLHRRESGHLAVIRDMLEEARDNGPVTAMWWAGGLPSLMHAKFVLADGTGGYFGTANLTSFGLGEHFEMGVALAPSQASSLLDLLSQLESASLFAPDPT